MQKAQSIKARLSAVFVFFFLLVIVLGLEGLRSVSYLNEVSAQIRDRWLPSTRALGDLNNFTTDFPAAEAAVVRVHRAEERLPILRQMDDLDRGIAGAERAYRLIPHDAAEKEVFARFDGIWGTYRRIVVDRQESSANPALAAADPLENASVSAYAQASAALQVLTDRNEASARHASELSGLAYAGARRRIVVTIVLAGLSVAGAMLYVQRSLSAPLLDLADRMHRLAANDISLEVSGTARRDEIGDMARAVLVFRNNATDLARSRQALAQQAAVLQKKLAEEQEVTLLQRNFVSMASHEFRTPLGIVDGHAQRIISMRDRLSPQEIAERARKVREAVLQMTQLIDDLIGSARLLDGPRDLYFRPTRVGLKSVLIDVCSAQRELTPDSTIFEDLGKSSLNLCGDAKLLRQLFGNLVSNGLKYSPAGGGLTVTAAEEGKGIVVAIEDHGIGIPEQDQSRVFERYFRASNTAGIAGSGVGLHLVKTIIDLHAGTIEVWSQQGCGSRFTVRLPAERV
jgi:two-component system OmpR family sensor kinase